ncbi:uncharacterized protein [Nicotiana tomentosiformis]|uniref:uncharacterized protein n=1 Tax=Nicotiana tomentosiformis TaxID=4098 RepID=UPI00388C9A53
MADRKMKRPLGIIDDVLVRVDKFILPSDFVILDCEVDYEVPIIMGRPFLDTRKALGYVEAGEITFRVGDKKVVFHVCNSMRQPNSNEVDATLAVLQRRKKAIGWTLADIRECLDNLDKVLACCEETNLVLNWEKCHFMVKEGIVLSHMISKNDIEVDRAKIEVISKLPPPTSIKGLRSFLGHAGFYR